MVNIVDSQCSPFDPCAAYRLPEKQATQIISGDESLEIQ